MMIEVVIQTCSYIAAIIIVCSIYFKLGMLEDKIKINERIDGIHHRIDQLRDWILQKQENDINKRENLIALQQTILDVMFQMNHYMNRWLGIYWSSSLSA